MRAVHDVDGAHDATLRDAERHGCALRLGLGEGRIAVNDSATAKKNSGCET
jgi:hypothetical protein